MTDTAPADELEALVRDLTKTVPMAKSEVKARVQKYTQDRIVAELEKLKKEMAMHTVPEGYGLITRSYLNNSIDFRVAEIKAGGKDAHS